MLPLARSCSAERAPAWSVPPRHCFSLDAPRGKPFELVRISIDRDLTAALGYLQTLRQIEKNGRPAHAGAVGGDLRSGMPPVASNAMPLTLVIDAKDATVARHAGRIAPEAGTTWRDCSPDRCAGRCLQATTMAPESHISRNSAAIAEPLIV